MQQGKRASVGDMPRWTTEVLRRTGEAAAERAVSAFMMKVCGMTLEEIGVAIGHVHDLSEPISRERTRQLCIKGRRLIVSSYGRGMSARARSDGMPVRVVLRPLHDQRWRYSPMPPASKHARLDATKKGE